MDRVLIQVKKRKDRRRFEDWLSKSYEIILGNEQPHWEEPFDLAIIDGPTLRQFRKKIRERRKAEQPVFLPFLLLTVRRRSSVPGRHLGRVVDDFIIRPLNEREIQARAANLLRMRHWSLDLKREHDRAMKLAVTDDVSGFNNTRYLHRYLDRLIDGASTKPAEVSLVFFDLDNFKHLVDAHGHLMGTKALKEVAQAGHKVLHEDDRLVRYGGDEFIAILPRQSRTEALMKVKRMKAAIASTPFLQKEGINARLTASFGLASYPHDARNKRELLAAADRCLFRSKSQGKDRISVVELEQAA